MSTPIEQIRARVDLHDLAERLGLERPAANGNYRSPHHKDRTPSLSIFERNGKQGWKDWSQDVGGDAIDLAVHVLGLEDAKAGVKWLCQTYGIEMPAANHESVREESRAEYIARKCRAAPDEAVRWLTEVRNVPRELAQRAVARGAVGWNTWTSPKHAPGSIGHGGPACAFIVRRPDDARVIAVDMRFADPALNGGVKTQSQGEKIGAPWVLDWQALRRAHTVVVVESAINAMSVEAPGLHGYVALAVRGTAAGEIDWRCVRGKRVIIGMDADLPDEKGKRPGPMAGWALHERLTALGVAAHLVDQAKWYEQGLNDWNDILKARDLDGVRSALHALDGWAIPGMPGKEAAIPGNRRIYLPTHDFAVYWRFKSKEDFTHVIETKRNEDGEDIEIPSDLAGFRIAALSRVTIQSATATMSGEVDLAPRVMFAVSVQTPQHGHTLRRAVLEDHQLHNPDVWARFGPVWSRGPFLRLVNLLGRAADIGARDAVNFVGLCWQAGRVVVNEGPDTYFSEPDKQCPYSTLQFPSGRAEDARRVIEAYALTFGRHAAAQLLVWSLGGHLKPFLGFWPHMVLQADKGTGKSTLIKRLERSIGFTMLSAQSLQTEFRLMTSCSSTTHPIGWEELSARRQEIIDKAVGLLQETYQYTVTRRGERLTEFVLCAPVLLAGEDVPVRSLLGKIVRVSLRANEQGALMPPDLPTFPVRQWLEWLAAQKPERVRDLHDSAREQMVRACRARPSDAGARRMVSNYAALAVAWHLLSEFARLPNELRRALYQDIVVEMNSHIGESEHEREPWVWITETLLSEIAAGRFAHPYAFEFRDAVPCLILRTSDVMHHLSSSPGLRDFYNACPVKSDRVYKRQMLAAGVVHEERVDVTIAQRRHSHMVALDLNELERFGLFAARPESVQ